MLKRIIGFLTLISALLIAAVIYSVLFVFVDSPSSFARSFSTVCVFINFFGWMVELAVSMAGLILCLIEHYGLWRKIYFIICLLSVIPWIGIIVPGTAGWMF